MLTRVSVGNAVRYYRKKKGIAQENLALMTKTSRSYMSKIERGECAVSVEKISEIAEALGVPVWEVLKRAAEL